MRDRAKPSGRTQRIRLSAPARVALQGVPRAWRTAPRVASTQPPLGPRGLLGGARRSTRYQHLKPGRQGTTVPGALRCTLLRRYNLYLLADESRTGVYIAPPVPGALMVQTRSSRRAESLNSPSLEGRPIEPPSFNPLIRQKSLGVPWSDSVIRPLPDLILRTERSPPQALSPRTTHTERPHHGQDATRPARGPRSTGQQEHVRQRRKPQGQPGA